MKVLLGTKGFGWTMFGLLGNKAKWFFGFSKNNHDNEISPELLAEVIDTTPEVKGVRAWPY